MYCSWALGQNMELIYSEEGITIGARRQTKGIISIMHFESWEKFRAFIMYLEKFYSVHNSPGCSPDYDPFQECVDMGMTGEVNIEDAGPMELETDIPLAFREAFGEAT